MTEYSSSVTALRSSDTLRMFPRVVGSVRTASSPAYDREQAAKALFSLRQLEVDWDEKAGTLWTFMRPKGRPSYNPDLLLDIRAWQDGVEAAFNGREDSLRYLVVGSRFPGIFSLGGDLDLFAQKIRSGDRDGLVHYGRSCVRVFYRNMTCLNLPVVTIGLVQGDALGGGFESLMSLNVVIAEKGARFGLPENLFGLFPGMGAFSFLSRRIGAAKAEAMILSSRTYSAEEMYDLGLVHGLAEPGEGLAAVQTYIEKNQRRQKGHYAIYKAAREVNPITMGELERIVDIWADASLQLKEQDLRMMERLVAAQDRLMRPTMAAAE